MLSVEAFEKYLKEFHTDLIYLNILDLDSIQLVTLLVDLDEFLAKKNIPKKLMHEDFLNNIENAPTLIVLKKYLYEE
jgi:acyl carrier protein